MITKDFFSSVPIWNFIQLFELPTKSSSNPPNEKKKID